MNKVKNGGVILGTVLSFSASQPAVSEVATTNVLTNGIVCFTMLASHADKVERKSWGILNKTMNQDVWLTCPFYQAQANTEIPAIGIVVDFKNRNNFSVSGSCLYREVSQSGEIVTTVATDYTIPANGAQVTGILGTTASAANSLTFACLLPRNSFIPRIQHITAQNIPLA